MKKEKKKINYVKNQTQEIKTTYTEVKIKE